MSRLFREVLVEQRDGLDAFEELLEGVVLLGAWMSSLARPKPIRMLFRPRIFSKPATMGIDPPLRVGMGRLP